MTNPIATLFSSYLEKVTRDAIIGYRAEGRTTASGRGYELLIVITSDGEEVDRLVTHYNNWIALVSNHSVTTDNMRRAGYRTPLDPLSKLGAQA